MTGIDLSNSGSTEKHVIAFTESLRPVFTEVVHNTIWAFFKQEAVASRGITEEAIRDFFKGIADEELVACSGTIVYEVDSKVGVPNGATHIEYFTVDFFKFHRRLTERAFEHFVGSHTEGP